MNARGAWEVLRVSLQLGLTSFGGPIAHLGYFDRTYVQKHRWLSGEQFASIVALCQILPGPASSQAGFLIGLHRAGWAGAVAAWIGFTLPSALLMVVAASFAARAEGPVAAAALQGLKLVAVAIVAQAVWTMANRLCIDVATRLIALLAAASLWLIGGIEGQLTALLLASVAGAMFCGQTAAVANVGVAVSLRAGQAAIAVLAALALSLAWAAWRWPGGLTELAQVFFRAGSLVFGGGHVVLPLLRDGLVPAGWITDDTFLGGYGLAQALPGPMFAVAGFLGAQSHAAAPMLAAAIAIICIFAPGLLLALAGAALWQRWTNHPKLRAALTGINAAVVGILALALYDPVFKAGVRSATDVAIALLALALLERWRCPPLAIVVLCVGTSVLRASWL